MVARRENASFVSATFCSGFAVVSTRCAREVTDCDIAEWIDASAGGSEDASAAKADDCISPSTEKLSVNDTGLNFCRSSKLKVRRRSIIIKPTVIRDLIKDANASYSCNLVVV